MPKKASFAKRAASGKPRRRPTTLPRQQRAVEPSADKQERWVGKPLVRKEEARLVRGNGKFIDDFKLPGMAYMRLVRSPFAHARITGVDVSAAQKHPGVLATLTGAEVAALTTPYIEIGPDPSSRIKDYCLAVDVARYQGEPVAAVIAQTRGAAEDAAELVHVEYEVLEPVVDAEFALSDKVVLHQAMGANKVWNGVFEYGDVAQAFKDAAYVVSIDRMHFHRFSSTPLENNAVIGQWDNKDDRVCFWTNNSFPTIGIQLIAPALGTRIDNIRVQTFDIGGSFGIKITNYPYMTLCALASRKIGGKPVKWTETRTEHMQASAHGNERTFLDTRVALDKDGVITAIESRHIDDCGAYPRYEPLGCVIWSQVFPGVYRFRNARIDFSQVVTNKCPVGPNRGYSRMQHLWFLERVVDICGHELGIPADEMRRRNYIRAEEFPYTTPNGCVYDSGNYAAMLALAQKLIGWDDWKKKQAAARAEGRMIGIGIGTTLDSGTNNFGQSRIVNPHAPFSGNSQAANVKLDIYGEIVVSVGSVPQGQGHETVASQVVADVLNVTPDMITVRVGFDTERNVHTGHTGTYASQFAVSGLSAVHGAAQKLRSELLRLAAYALNAPIAKLELGLGKMGAEVRVKGSDKSINYWALANIINVNNAGLPDELQDVTLNCRYTWRAPFKVPDIEKKYGNLTLTYSSQLHIAVVEIERGTFNPKVLDYAAVDDCGTVINPRIVEGQVHGATAHGIGAALMENCAYDQAGNLLASTFSEYTPIMTVNMPTLKCGYIETPSPHSYSGAKGMGEGGAAPIHTISAALQDALHSAGIYVTDSFNNGDSIFRALEQRKAGRPVGNVRTEQRATRKGRATASPGKSGGGRR
ncbi:MAG TPA: xanthine dehydrogenase family protein molybdopterin-binding subunit [Terriglobales bacterium]|nr:xanthine dehydrogenase family protein molybdopterin-binding subunit [Terriglobales bacterium]